MTSPTPRPPCKPRSRCSATARRASSEERLTHAFVADAVADLAGKVFGREDWGVDAHALDSTREYVARFRDAAFLALATTEGPGTSATTSRWCRTRSAGSRTRS